MVTKPTTLLLESDVIQSLKIKGFNISKTVREILKEYDKQTGSKEEFLKNNE